MIGEYVMPKQSKMSNVAYEQLNQDADRILHLIKVQMDNLTYLHARYMKKFSTHKCLVYKRS